MNPCNGPKMSNAAWRAFMLRHPHWHAPAVAPCSASAAKHWLAHVGTPLAVGAAAAGAGIALIRPALRWASGYVPALPTSVSLQPANAVAVPEPSSLWLLIIALGVWGAVMLFVWCLCAIASTADRGK